MKYILPTLVCLCLFIGVLAINRHHEDSQKVYDSRLKLPGGIDEGDLVFRRGRGIASHMVLSAENSGTFSHVGIIVKIGDSLLVAHETPGEASPGKQDVLKTERISDYFSEENARCGAIMHVVCPDSLKTVATGFVKMELEENIPFDHEYNLKDSTKLYCTELVWMAYLKAGIDLTNGRRTKINIPLFSGDYILPSDIEKSPYLKNYFSFNRS